MSIVCVAHLRSAHGMIEWLWTQKRRNPEVAIILSTAAPYRQATKGSSHDDARPDSSMLHTGVVRPHSGFVGTLLYIAPYGPSFAGVRNAASVFVHFVGMRFSSGGDDASVLLVGSIG
jgi:hypothetical protein